jgi:hypothetical protein
VARGMCNCVFRCPGSCGHRSDRSSTFGFSLNSLFLFGGGLTRGNLGETARFSDVRYEDNHILGVAYSRDLVLLPARFSLAAEIGAANRFGDGGSSFEGWVGPQLRHRGVELGPLTIRVAVTAGISVVQGPIGIEIERELEVRGDATTLFYLGPEVSLSMSQWPNVELVYRLHHRSGALGTLGGLEEGHNANVLGVRARF